MAKLEILSGKGAGTVVELEPLGNKITLGNRRTATVQVRDPWISFVHAELEAGGGGWTIVDKRSKAGTTVNGQQVGVRPQALNDGDTIALGKTEMRFSDGAAAAPKGKGKAKAAGAPAAAAPAPASIGGMDPLPAGPFSPPKPAPAAGDAGRLAADLERARAEADGLRQALMARERALSEAQARATALDGADPEALRAAEQRAAAAEQLAQQATAALEDTKSKARIRLEELQRLNQALEARLQGGGADAVQLERQLAQAREELRRLQDEARRRFELLQQEKAQLEQQLAGGGGADPAELEELKGQLGAAEARAEQAESRLDALEDEVGTVQSQKRELDLELEDLRQQLASASKAQAHGGEEVAALEKAIADLNEDLTAARAERREALQALQDKDTMLADLRGKANTGRIDPAQISGLRRQLSELEDKLAQREKELEQARNDADVARTALEDTGGGGGDRAAALEQELAQVKSQLAASEAARQAAEARAAAAPAAAAAAAAAPAGDGGGDAAALQARVAELEGENAALLRDLEEINEDMLAQEEEYQERIQELEARLGEA